MKSNAQIFTELRKIHADLVLVGSTARACLESRSIRGSIEVFLAEKTLQTQIHVESELEAYCQTEGLLLVLHLGPSLEHFLEAQFFPFRKCWVSTSEWEKSAKMKLLLKDCDSVAACPNAILQKALRLSETGRTWDGNTLKDMRAPAARILSLSSQTIFVMLNQIMVSRFPSNGIRFLEAVGVLSFLLPEVSLLKGFHRSSKFHHKDVYEHTLQVVDQAVPKSLVRWSALLHDVGKLHTRSYTDDGQVHFFKHDEVGAYLCDGISHRLGFPKVLSQQLKVIVLLHLRPGLYTAAWSDSAIRRLMREAGETLPDLIALARADNTTKRMTKRLSNLRNVKALSDRCAQLARDDSNFKVCLPQGLGNAIKQHFNLGQGPRIGEMVSLCSKGLRDGRLDADAPIEMHLAFLQNEIMR